MKKEKIFFHPINGGGSLSISWSSRPKGDAVEAKRGSGVGFFSEKGDLLCVIFDEVKSDNDHQILEFDYVRIEISVKNGSVQHNIEHLKVNGRKISARSRKRRSTQRLMS